MLGGESGIYNTLTSENPVFKVSLRPADPMAHPIASETSTDPCVVIRVKVVKKYKIIDGKKVLFDVEYVPEYIGATVITNSFNQPSDFQFLPPLNSPINTPTVEDLPELSQSFLYFPPPVFMHNYKYDAHYMQKRIFASQQSETSKLWKGTCEWLVNQNDLMALERGPRPSAILDNASEELMALFKEMFEFRPIWTSLAIYDYLNKTEETRGSVRDLGESTAVIFHSLSAIAYHIKTGPFKMCWVKYGINPLLDSQYRMFQVCVVSLRDWDFADELMKRVNRKSNKYVAKKINTVPVGMSRGMALPDRLYFGVQLCDIEHPLIDNILSEYLPKYTFSTGWFSQSQITDVRDFLLLSYQRMITTEGGETMVKMLMANVATTKDVRNELGTVKPKRERTDLFDYQLLADAQAILGVYDSGGGSESVAELAERMNKAPAFVMGRHNNY